MRGCYDFFQKESIDYYWVECYLLAVKYLPTDGKAKRALCWSFSVESKAVIEYML